MAEVTANRGRVKDLETAEVGGPSFDLKTVTETAGQALRGTAGACSAQHQGNDYKVNRKGEL